MKRTIRLICVLAALLLALSVLPAGAQTVSAPYALGSQMQDFTVTTYDGREINLQETLKEKDMVLINIWASWCGPCGMEFPFMEEAYQQFKEDVEIIAVSCEPNDTNEVLADYAAEKGLTFPIAQDTANLAQLFGASSIPVSAVVDRFGTVCFIQPGAQTSTDAFVRLFDAFVGEEYTESLLLNSIPAMKPNIPKASAERLAAAANAQGGALTFINPTGKYVWPMIPAETEDGRLCLMATNGSVSDTTASVYADVTVNAGDAAAVTFRLSSEAASDMFELTVDGETVKVFSGERDWMTYAHAFEAAGTYRLGLHYVKDVTGHGGEDTVYIDSLAVLTGEDAAAACAENPVYPVAADSAILVQNEGAREIAFTDPYYALTSLFGIAKYYIVPGGEAELLVQLDASVDPEGAFFVNYYDGSVSGLMAAMTDDGYAFRTKIDSIATTRYPYTNVHLYPSRTCTQAEIITAVCFPDEENVEAFLKLVNQYGMGVSGWEYVQETSAALPIRQNDQTTYTLVFIDQNGDPVPGVIANICDEERCMPMTADVTGMISFNEAPYPYDVHILMVPAGYGFDTTQSFTAPQEGGVMTFTLDKN